MHAIEIVESSAPLILVVYPSRVDPEAYRAAMVRYRALSSRYDRVGYVIDFRKFDPVFASAVVRREAAKVFAENAAELAKNTVCEARVVENPISRGVLVAFDWITPPKWPTDNVATMSEALAFVRRYLGPSVTLPSQADDVAPRR